MGSRFSPGATAAPLFKIQEGFPMMIAVRYDSKTGNTKRLADAIASALGVRAEMVDIPLPGKVDVLFLGSAVYAAGVSQDVRDFINHLSAEQVGAVACFSTAALLPSTFAQVSRLLRARGINVLEKEFHCRGQFHFMHKGKPDDEDLARARQFAKSSAGEKP